MLSPKAEQRIKDYLELPFKGIKGVRCPYYNNARSRERGQLRVLIGKGLPHEIVEEAQIISIQYHAGLFTKEGECCLHNAHESTTTDAIRKFLIDHQLGIECSGFVTHVLRAHFLETKKIDITKKLHIISKRRIIRWLITRLRPVENINVRTYTDPKNSRVIVGHGEACDAQKLAPGDVITMLETGPNHKRNHILVITDIQGDVIHYAHARAWTSEGQYGHGIARGTITIQKPSKGLLEQVWEEKKLANDKNETYWEAAQAHTLEIRRLHV